MRPHPRFVWVGAAHDASGHADELRGFLRAQEAAGHAPALDNVSWTDRRAELSPADAAMLERQAARASTIVPQVAVHTSLPGGTGHVAGPSNVARAMFETDRLPGTWLEPLLGRDQVWVPCRHNLEAFADSGLPEHRLRILGGTLDFSLFHPAADPYPLDTEPGRARFLTNFDFSARKGWEVLLRAWARAFDADDPVSLVLKTGSFYRDDRWVTARLTEFLRTELATVPGGLAPVHLLTDLLPAEAMPSLYAAADAYVLASRGEGWGRPFMEAQAMGLPTIASRWGGQREFLDADTTWLVDGELVAVPTDADLFNDLYAGHRWFEPDVDSLVAQLRDVARDWTAARARTAPARERLVARFGADATAARLRELGAELADRRAAPDRLCVVRGRFGSADSLSTVNDGLSGALERAGWTVGLVAPGAVLPAPVPTISHHWPHDFSAASTGPAVVVVPWEYGAPPAEWVREARRRADRIWVPSAYVRDRMVAAGMPAGIVDVVPNGVDTDRFIPAGPAAPLPTRAGCTFLFVGGTIWRKGIDLLTRAWTEAFAPADDVALVIRDFGASTLYRGQNAAAELRRFAQRTDIAPVVHLVDDVPAREIPDLYRAADVLVAPYRGEGFGMPVLEAMACGRPVIHTGTGPTAEFVPDEAGWALAAEQTPMADVSGLPPLAGEAHVQEPSLSALVAALRAAAGDAAERRRRGVAARAAAERQSWDAVAAIAASSLQALAADGPALARDARPELVDPPADRALVLYAPNWRDETRFTETLLAWAATFGERDPVTLALVPGAQDPEFLAARILERMSEAGVDADALPDLMLCDGSTQARDVLCHADAVLADPGTTPRRELARRAPQVLVGDRASLEGFRAGLLTPEAMPA